MRLYLVQHGEAAPKDVDPDRPLTSAGRADVEALARFLERQGVSADRVVHSGKTRARETAEALARGIAPQAAIETAAGLAPNDPVEPIAAEAQGMAEDTVLVGHLPFMARLASRLLTGREEPAVAAFRPGSLLCLERDEAGAWTVAWMIRPELLHLGG